MRARQCIDELSSKFQWARNMYSSDSSTVWPYGRVSCKPIAYDDASSSAVFGRRIFGFFLNIRIHSWKFEHPSASGYCHYSNLLCAPSTFFWNIFILFYRDSRNIVILMRFSGILLVAKSTVKNLNRFRAFGNTSRAEIPSKFSNGERIRILYVLVCILSTEFFLGFAR